MIELAFNSKLQLKRWISNNYDGTKNFEEPISLECYKEDKLTKVLSSTGEEVMSKSNFFTVKPITIHDMIDDRQVITVETFNMLGCKYYRSYT